MGHTRGGVEVVVDVVEPPWLGSRVKCGSPRMRSSVVGIPRAFQEAERRRARAPSIGSMLTLVSTGKEPTKSNEDEFEFL
jgi:hypothetical protein